MVTLYQDDIARAYAIGLKYEDYLKTHDIGIVKNCDISENRLKIKIAGKDLYCWRGLIKQQPNCVSGTQCDPYSYTNARARFCLTWGGCEPFKFVGNPKNEQSPVLNRRGGIVTYNPMEDCGTGTGFFNCLKDGVGQSLDNAASQPQKTLMGVAVGIGALLVGTILVKSHPKVSSKLSIKTKPEAKKFYHPI